MKISVTFKLRLNDVPIPVNGPVVSLDTRPVIDSFSHDVSKQITQTLGDQFVSIFLYYEVSNPTGLPPNQ